MHTTDFSYDLPDKAIAQSAIEPRHDARLLTLPQLADHEPITTAGIHNQRFLP